MADWKSDLDQFFQDQTEAKQASDERLEETRSEVVAFFDTVVRPAFEEVKTELEKHGRSVDAHVGRESGSITVSRDGNTELRYSVEVPVRPGHAHPYPKTRFRDRSDGNTYVAEGYFRSGSQDYTIADITKEEVIKHFLADYKDHVCRG